MRGSRSSQSPERNISGGPDRKRTRIDEEEEEEEAPRPCRPCCSCNNLCETEKDHNWLNMGPPTTDTPRFWCSIEIHKYVDWEKAVTGTYGTYLPLCRACMKAIRSAILANNEAQGAEAIAISMLAEQIYYKIHKIDAATS